MVFWENDLQTEKWSRYLVWLKKTISWQSRASTLHSEQWCTVEVMSLFEYFCPLLIEITIAYRKSGKYMLFWQSFCVDGNNNEIVNLHLFSKKKLFCLIIAINRRQQYYLLRQNCRSHHECHLKLWKFTWYGKVSCVTRAYRRTGVGVTPYYGLFRKAPFEWVTSFNSPSGYEKRQWNMLR